MRADFPILIDACVLANYGVCDLLLQLAEKPRLFVPHWSEGILDEVKRTHLTKLKWPEHVTTSFQRMIREAFPHAVISDYEGLVPGLTNDLKDRHVLAAAIRGNCPLILTFNLKHFKPEALMPHGIHACHPAEYLTTLYEMAPQQVMAIIGQSAGHRNLKIEDYLIRLGKAIPAFASRILEDTWNR